MTASAQNLRDLFKRLSPRNMITLERAFSQKLGGVVRGSRKGTSEISGQKVAAIPGECCPASVGAYGTRRFELVWQNDVVDAVDVCFNLLE